MIAEIDVKDLLINAKFLPINTSLYELLALDNKIYI